MTTTTTTPPPSYTTTEARNGKPSSSKSKDKSSSSGRSKKTSSPSTKEKDEGPTPSKSDERPSPYAVQDDTAEPTVPDVLTTFAGESFRRSRCDPEFLEQFARDPTVVSGDDGQEGWEDRVKVIVGAEAASFYKSYVKQHKTERVDKTEDIPSGNEAAIVFACVVTEAGRKFVDYYLTWRGKIRVKDLRGAERKPDFLDSEFKRVARKFDKGYKKAQTPPISTIGTEPIVQSPIEEEAPETSPRKPAKLKRSSSKKKEPVTPTKASTSDEPERPPSPKIPDPPSPGSSVRSLPLLNMIRNVPYGNRVPLRVVNPDLESLSSTPRNSIAPRPSILSFSGLRNSLFGGNLQVNVSEAPKEGENQQGGTRLETVLEEGSVVDGEETKAEELTEHAEPVRVNPSISSNGSVGVESVVGVSPSVADPPRKKKKKSKRKITSEFMIVVLDQHQQRELEKKKKPHTWHGMERKVSTKVVPMRARSDGANASSWNAPLVHADGITFSTPKSRRAPHQSSITTKGKNYLPTYLQRRSTKTVPIYIRNSDQSGSSGSETEDEPPWMDSPVVPLAPSGMSVMSHDGVIPYTYPQNGYGYPQFAGPGQGQMPVASPYAIPLAAMSRASSAVSSTSSSTRSSPASSSYVTPYIAPPQADVSQYPSSPYQAAQPTPSSYLTTPKLSQNTLQPPSHLQIPSSGPQQGGGYLNPNSPLQHSLPQSQMPTPIHVNPNRLPTPISTQPVYPPSAYTNIPSIVTPSTPNVNANTSLHSHTGHMMGQNGMNGQGYGNGQQGGQQQQQGGTVYPQSPYVYSIAVPSSAR